MALPGRPLSPEIGIQPSPNPSQPQPQPYSTVGVLPVWYKHSNQTVGEFELTQDQLRIWYSDGWKVLNFVPMESP